jgi:hypothetical protein
LPFFRPLGDVCWAAVLFAGILAVGAADDALARRWHAAPAAARRRGR